MARWRSGGLWRASCVLVIVGLWLGCGTAPPPATESKAKDTGAKANEAKGETAQKPAAKADAKPETPVLKVGSMRMENLATLYAADQLGYFADEGLKIEVTESVGGAEVIPLLQAGKLHIGFTGTVSALLAGAQGFDFVILSGIGTANTKSPDPNRILVKAGSDVKTAKDLEGKRMSVNLIGGSPGWLYSRAWLKKNGADPDKVTFQEVPYPQVADVLVNNRVAASASIEPFGTVGIKSGKVVALADYMTEVTPGATLGTWTAPRNFVQTNPNTVKAFLRAFKRSVDLMQDDKERRKWIAEYTKTEPELLKDMVLAPIRMQVDIPTTQKVADLMVEHGMLKEKIDVAKYVGETARN